MYALARNSWKYLDRDKRIERIQHIEYDVFAPDSVNEMFDTLTILEETTGKAFYKKTETKKKYSKEEYAQKGKELLTEQNKIVDELEIIAESFENSKRKTILIKVKEAYSVYTKMISYYGINQLIEFIKLNNFSSREELIKAIPPGLERNEWINVGGQLMTTSTVDILRDRVRTGKLKCWDDIHDFYTSEGKKYDVQKIKHALASLAEIKNISLKKLDAVTLSSLLQEVIQTKEWITESIYSSRAKDYKNPYRKMVYESFEEMNKVIGKLEDNSFIQYQEKELKSFKKEIASLKKKMKLK